MINFSDDYIHRALEAQRTGRLKWEPEVFDFVVRRADPALAPLIGVVLRDDGKILHVAWADQLLTTRETRNSLWWLPTAEDLRVLAAADGFSGRVPGGPSESECLSAYVAAAAPKGVETSWVVGRGWTDVPAPVRAGTCEICGGSAGYAPPWKVRS